MNEPNERALLSAKRVLTQTILAAFPVDGQLSRPVPASEIPSALWSELVPAANQHGLAALFYASLKDTTQEALPAEPLAELRDRYLRSRMATRLANDALGALLDVFARQNVRVLVLKGAALSSVVYPEPGLRPFGDVDLMVQRADVPTATNLLEREGYVLADERREGFSEQFLKSLNLTSSRALGPSLDLHWHLFAPTYYRTRIDVAYFWRAPLAMTVANRPAFTLAPMPQLVHLCAHAGLHTVIRLIWLLDITRWIAKFQGELDWSEFVRVVRQFEVAPAVTHVLEEAKSWWNAAVPSETLATLGKIQTGRQARMVYAVYSSPQGGARGLVDMVYQEGMGNKLKYAGQLLVPSQEYIVDSKRTGSSKSLPGLYARRIWGIAKYVMGSVWELVTPKTRRR